MRLLRRQALHHRILKLARNDDAMNCASSYYNPYISVSGVIYNFFSKNNAFFSGLK